MGYELGQQLVEILNQQSTPPHMWMMYNKCILKQLAEQTHQSMDLLDKERRSDSGWVTGFTSIS
jgi:hypothetical protein